MDAVEFIRGRERMCRTFNMRCRGCEIADRMEGNESCNDYIKRCPAEAVAIVEKWSKEHPRKTRQSEFLKMFPEAFVYQGSIDIEPCKIVKSKYDTEQCKLRKTREWSCENCREQFWHEEVE
nr:MAG TPA: YokU-like protein [Caudoviricetes sp.]